MIDPLSLIVGAVIAVSGFAAGRLARRVDVRPPRAVCGCGHGLDQHDPTDERCHAENSRPTHNQHGEVVGCTYVPGTCRRYVGPLPVDQFLRTELLAS